MHLFSWNIQSGKGCNGHTDIQRIIDHIISSCDHDLICLQEIVRNMQEYCAQGQMDQLRVFRNAFSAYSFVWGTGFSWPKDTNSKDNNQEFGNLTLIKNQLLDYRLLNCTQICPGNCM